MAARQARQRDVVRFVCVRDLPLGTRVRLISGLLIAGIAVQCGTHFLLQTSDLVAQVAYSFLGWPFVLAAALLSQVRGSTNEPTPKGPGQWESVTIDEFERVLAIQKQTQLFRAHLGPLAANSWGGGCALAAVLCLVGMGCAVLFSASPESHAIAITVGIDALTLLLPLWLCGLMTAWQPLGLPEKIKAMVNIYRNAMRTQDPDLIFSPMLELQPATGGKLPKDARMLVRWKGAPEGYIGLQVQMTFNNVQGRRYPYLYCVLLARHGFPLHASVKPLVTPPEEPSWLKRVFGRASAQEKKEARFSTYRGEVVELVQETDVEVVVVRQKAVGTGYLTPPSAQERVFGNALLLGRAVLASSQ